MPFQALPRNTVIFLCATLGCVGVLAISVIVVSMLTTVGRRPEHVLPAQETVLFLRNPTEELLTSLTSMFPELQSVTLKSPGDTVALLEGKDQRGIALFSPAYGEISRDIGTFTVTASPEVMALLEEKNEKLGNLPAFRGLVDSEDTGQEITFMQVNVLGEAMHISSIKTENGIVLQFFSPSIRRWRQMPGTITTIPSAFFVLGTTGIGRLWEELKQIIPAAERQIAEAKLTTFIEHHFGNDVSLTYTLLPLMEGPATIMLAERDGETAVLIEGQAENKKLLTSFIEKLHASYVGSLSPTRITKYVLDEEHSSTDIRYDEDQIQEEEKVQDGWSVRTVRYAEGEESFATATKGLRLLIASDATLLEEYLTEAEELRSGLHGGGRLNVEKTRSLLQGVFPSLMKVAQFPLFPRFQESILWFLTAQGPVLRLSITGN